MPREIFATSGANEPLTAVITDSTHADISDCTFEVQLVPAAGKALTGAWEDATPAFTVGEGSTETNVATVGLQVSGGNTQAEGDYRLWVRVTDGSNQYVLPAPEVVHAG
jgi:hypothetical protein